MAPDTRGKTRDELPPEELERRVAVLKRFRELLVTQRDKFRDYLIVLDKQHDVIEKGDVDALTNHVEMEERIVSDIFAIQKVVDPLEDLYRAAYPSKEAEVPQLKAALEGLKTEVAARSARNRELLSEKMEGIRAEIKTLRNNPFASRRSVYADSGSPSLIDIKG